MSTGATGQDAPRPIHWPSLTPDEAGREWEALLGWVDQLRARYPHVVRLPECWWRHNDLVEVLAALRDCERACYHPGAAATGPIEWQRALRDMEIRIEIWIKRFTCTVPGRGHDTTAARPDVGPDADGAGEPDGWREFVVADIDRRHAHGGGEPPTGQ